MSRAPLSEARRHPLLTEAGRRLLRRLQEHRGAPRYTFACGDQLNAEGVQRVRDYERMLQVTPVQRGGGDLPATMEGFVERCLRDVPFYRTYGAYRFEHVPLLGRDDLQATPWAFVPDHACIEEMLVYESSGTLGSRLVVPSHPVVSSSYIALLRRMLARRGVTLEGGEDRVSIVMVGFHRHTLTYATVSSYLDGAAFVKLNLNLDDWPSPEARVRFLDECAPEIYSGDPISFAELAGMPLRHGPKAMVSTSMALLPALQAQLEARFGCPVFDLYSMTECRAMAFASETPGVCEVLRPDLYVEVVDAEGRGTDGVGEIVVTSSFNPYLPLLRYRTGDYGRLESVRGVATLTDLQGRRPTIFRHADGRLVNNIDVTLALSHLPLSQVRLLQRPDGSLQMQWRGDGVPEAAVREALGACLGGWPMDLTQGCGPLEGKWLQYHSEVRPPGM